jgi:hypothetical protein
MTRFTSRKHNWLKVALLLVYLALASGDQFLHNHPLEEFSQSGQSDSLGVHGRHSFGSPSFLQKAVSAHHHGECLACIWASHSKNGFAWPENATTLTPRIVGKVWRVSTRYASTTDNHSPIRGPPQA